MEKFRQMVLFKRCLRYSQFFRNFSTNLYPKIVPKYPDNDLTHLTPETAWQFYEDGQTIRKIPEVSDRLEQFGSDFRDKKSYAITSLDDSVGNLKFKQHITNTHILPSIPFTYRKEFDPESYDLVHNYSERSKSDISNIIKEAKKYRKNDNSVAQFSYAHHLTGQIINYLVSSLALNYSYILHSQIDEDVKVKCFWLKDGYANEDIRGKASLIYDDFALFQYRGDASFQLRTKLPLSAVLPHNHSDCFGDHETVDYTPRSIGVNYVEEAPQSISGHWIGDPCEFVYLSCHVLKEDYHNLIRLHGKAVAEQETVPFGLISSYASAVAQAYNQGFSFYHDITYPFVVQSVITDGENFRFCVYQLNTLQTWQRSDDKNKRNLFWYSDMINLFDNDIFNLDALNYFFKFLTFKPVHSETNLKPHVDIDMKDRYEFIKSALDEPIIERPPKIGRYRYPRNAIYH